MLASPLAALRQPQKKSVFEPPQLLVRSVPPPQKPKGATTSTGLTAAASPWVPSSVRIASGAPTNAGVGHKVGVTATPLAPKPAPEALGDSPRLNPAHLQKSVSSLSFGDSIPLSPLTAKPPVPLSKTIITAEAAETGLYTYEMFLSLRKDCAHTPRRVLNWAVELYRANPIIKTPAHLLLALDEPLIEDDGTFRDAESFRLRGRRRPVRQIQHKVMSILSRVTPQKYLELQRELLELPLKQTSDTELKEVVKVFFEKAVQEQTFSPLYANLVADMCRPTEAEKELDREQREKLLAYRLRKELLTTCQEEFKRPLQLSDDDKVDATTGKRLEDEEIEYKRDRLESRLCGNIKFVGELYKKKLVTERVVGGIMDVLVGDFDPKRPTAKEEHVFKVFQTLLTSVGVMCKETNPEMLQRFMDIAKKIECHPLPRVRFWMMGLEDLARRGWVTKDRLLTMEERERELLEEQRRGAEDTDRRARQRQQEIDELVLSKAIPHSPLVPLSAMNSSSSINSPVMAGAPRGIPPTYSVHSCNMPSPVMGRGTGGSSSSSAPSPASPHHVHHHVIHHHLHHVHHHHHLHHHHMPQHPSGLTAPPPPPLTSPTPQSPTAPGGPSLAPSQSAPSAKAAPTNSNPPPAEVKHPHGTPTSSPGKGNARVSFQVTHLSAGLMTPPPKYRNAANMSSVERSPVVHASLTAGNVSMPPSLSSERLSDSLHASSMNGMRRVGSASSVGSVPMSPNIPPAASLYDTAQSLMTEFEETKQVEKVLSAMRGMNIRSRISLLTHWLRRVSTTTKLFQEREQICQLFAGILSCVSSPKDAILSPHDLAVCFLEWLRYDIEKGQFGNCPRLFANIGGMIQQLYTLLMPVSSPPSPSKGSRGTPLSPTATAVPPAIAQTSAHLQGILNGMVFTVLLRELHAHELLPAVPTLVKDAHSVVSSIVASFPSQDSNPRQDLMFAIQNRFRILPFVLYGDGALTRAKTPPTPTHRGGSPLNDSLGIYDAFSQCLVLPKVAEDIEFVLYRRMRESDSASSWREFAVTLATATGSSAPLSGNPAGRLTQVMKVVGTLLTIFHPKDATQPLVAGVSKSAMDEIILSILSRRKTIEYQAAAVVELMMHFTYSVANITAPAYGNESPNKAAGPRTPMKDRAMMGGSLTEAAGSWSTMDTRLSKMTNIFKGWTSSGMIDGPAVLQLLKSITENPSAGHHEAPEDIAMASRVPEDLFTLQFNFISEASWTSTLQMLSN